MPKATGKREASYRNSLRRSTTKKRKYVEDASAEPSVQINISGDLANQYVAERGTLDDNMFMEDLLKAYRMYKIMPTDKGDIAGSSILDVNNVTDDGQTVSTEDQSDSYDNIPDNNDTAENEVTVVKVEIDGSDYNAGNQPNPENLTPQQLVNSNCVEILMTKTNSISTKCEICEHYVIGETKRFHTFSEHFILHVKCGLCESKSEQVDACEFPTNIVEINDYFNHRHCAHNDTLQKCPFCEKIIDDKHMFLSHMINVHWKHLYCYCMTCVTESTVPDPALLLKGVSVVGHILKKHSYPETKRVTCDTCGVILLQFNLARHIKQVHQTSRGVCELCGKSCNDVVRHKKRVHDETRSKYECETCGKKLTSKWNLTVHKRLHTGEKPFTCELCGKSFCQKVELQLHIKSNHIGKMDDQSSEFTEKPKEFENQSKCSLPMTNFSNQVMQQDILHTAVSCSELSQSPGLYAVISSQGGGNIILGNAVSSSTVAHGIAVLDVGKNNRASHND